VAESRAASIYSTHYVDVCDRWYGWIVYVQPATGVEHSWQSPAGRTVRGLTWRKQQTVQVGSADWEFNSYAHEMLHAAEAGETVAGEDPDKLWESSWQPAAITKAQGH
jgi:hypothetical protein